MTAINSHVILPIARECAAHEGDLWIIYMGNNEMVGPFGAATVFGQKAPPLGLVRMNLAIQRTRLGQLLLALSHKLHNSDAATWHGMEMFLENKIPPDDPRKEVVYHSYARNLDDILNAGMDAGAKVILSTVAVNLKDCPPLLLCPTQNWRRRTAFPSTVCAGRARPLWSATTGPAPNHLWRRPRRFFRVPRMRSFCWGTPCCAKPMESQPGSTSSRRWMMTCCPSEPIHESTALLWPRAHGWPNGGLCCLMRWPP